MLFSPFLYLAAIISRRFSFLLTSEVFFPSVSAVDFVVLSLRLPSFPSTDRFSSIYCSSFFLLFMFQRNLFFIRHHPHTIFFFFFCSFPSFLIPLLASFADARRKHHSLTPLLSVRLWSPGPYSAFTMSWPLSVTFYHTFCGLLPGLVNFLNIFHYFELAQASMD